MILIKVVITVAVIILLFSAAIWSAMEYMHEVALIVAPVAVESK